MVEISGYAVGELLRASAQHAAYRAVRTIDERSVVLKVPVEAYPTPRALARLRHEFEITHDLDIPGIVRALSIENHSHGQVFVLEDIGGVALSEQIGPRMLPLGRALEIGVRLSEALKGVHAHGIIHKDVKPSNTFVAMSLSPTDRAGAYSARRESPMGAD